MSEETINAEEWNKLPWLIPRKTVRNVCGLTDEDLMFMERKGVLHRVRTGARCGKYFKTELKNICKIE